MTELEDAWDGLSPAEPPVSAILGQGRARQRARRRRPLQIAGGVAALAAAFSMGVMVTDGVAPTRGSSTNLAMRPVAFQADLVPASNCDELLAAYQARGVEQVTAHGWFDGGLYIDAGFAADLAAPLARASGSTLHRGQSASDTGTNVQEFGVDEPDIAKVDGNRIVRVRGNELQVFDAAGPEPRLEGSVRLPRMLDAQLLLAGDTVVALGRDSTAGTRVVTVSIEEPAAPTIVTTTTYTSTLVDARQHGETIRLVLSEALPALDFVEPWTDNVTAKEALRRNREIVRSTTIEDWLPQFTGDDGPRSLLDCESVAVPSGQPPLGTTSVVGISADDPVPSAIALAGAVDIAYSSQERMYLADRPWFGGCIECLTDRGLRRNATATTHVYEFELSGSHAVHVASGEVDGTLADRWSMDEVDGVLRLAIATPGGRDNALVTLRRNDQRLEEIGVVDGLGVNEEIKAVRWFDDLAVIVTFRRTDPLYTIDLSDPAAPELLGELKIPGFSDYLHPIGHDLLLGVGYTSDRETDVKVSLYDVSDPTNVDQTVTVEFPGQRAIAPGDPRAFTWFPEHDTALTVVQKGRRVSIAQVGVAGTTLTERIVRIEDPGVATQVRTFALPDGRIVLVTGGGVEIFSLD